MTVFDVLVKKLEELRDPVTEVISGGGCKDFDSYRDSCGFIRGLDTAIREIEDLAKANREDDD